MIKDALSEIISNDSSCLLGLIKFDKSKFLYSIAPVRYENVLNDNINIADIESKYSSNNPMRIFGEWSTEAGIFECDGCQVQNDNVIGPYNDFVCSNDSNEDWKISTNLKLNDVLSHEKHHPNDLTMMILSKIEPSDLFNIDNCDETIDFSYTYEYEHEYTETIINQNGEEETIIETEIRTETENESEVLNSINFEDIFEYVINDNFDEFGVPPFKKETARYIAKKIARDTAYSKKLDEIRNNATIQLFKHCYKINETKLFIDIRFIVLNKINEDDDHTEICGKLFFDVIYFDGTKKHIASLDINLSNGIIGNSEVSLANKLFDNKWHLLSFIIESNYYKDINDVYDFVLSVFDGEEQIDNFQINENFDSKVDEIFDSSEDELKFNICGHGSHYVKMKDVFVYNRYVRPEEIKFLKLLLNFGNN